MPKSRAEQFELPPRFILYTVDQLATMFAVSETVIKRHYLHYERRSVGAQPGDKMLARNISPPGEKPEWRISEKEVINYLRKRGFRIYDRAQLS